MRHVVFAFLCAFCVFAGRVPSRAADAPPNPEAAPASIAWRDLLPGFALAEVTAEDPYAEMVIVRINPERYDFTLHMASEGQNGSLAEIAKAHSLLAAVNAGMYLPDQITNTGYMKSPTHVNNPRIASRFGAFFVACPKKKHLPRAALLDRQTDNWQSALDEYSLAVQNYRLINTRGEVLWTPGAAAHCIAALGQDAEGNILLLFSKTPMNPAAFAATLVTWPLNIRSLMYLEGGSPAALLVRAGDVDELWSGNRFGRLLGTRQSEKPTPNILGIRARSGAEREE